MITINDIKKDMDIFGESDSFYFDSINDVGYHLHKESNGNTTCMKNTGRQITPISEDEFINAVNSKCFGNSISADSYFIFKKMINSK